ncbi:BgtE-2438 [Blumeria graminis f. sp. tritici]|uniref:BgtE-2438 n=2 Tax=Blumeria graminis f. sp. tritici TaxID=62690 RepID=A0A061HD54_BLUGR|nr:putative secreted effector protein [Blumeria graminis f. sp. tritici 96224]VDB96380.1 BgtE-2438 [Blumeria graminis f. sp. tritici]
MRCLNLLSLLPLACVVFSLAIPYPMLTSPSDSGMSQIVMGQERAGYICKTGTSAIFITQKRIQRALEKARRHIKNSSPGSLRDNARRNKFPMAFTDAKNFGLPRDSILWPVNARRKLVQGKKIQGSGRIVTNTDLDLRGLLYQDTMGIRRCKFYRDYKRKSVQSDAQTSGRW